MKFCCIILLSLLLAGITTGCRIFYRLPEEITDPRVRELHGLGRVPDDETWWQSRDRRIEDQDKLLFNFPLNERWARPFESGRALTCTPVVDQRMIFLTEEGLGLVGLNEEDGIVVWSLSPRGGEVFGPLVEAGGLLVFGTSGGRVLAVDRFLPRLVWESDLGHPPVGPPASGGELVYFPVGGSLAALSLTDGSLQWQRSLAGLTAITTPLVETDNGRLFCGSDAGTLFCLNTVNGEERWHYEAGAPILATPLLSGRRLYFGDDAGRFHCLDAADGTARWIKPTGASIRTAAASWEDLVLFGSWDGFLYALDRKNGRTRWKSLLPNRIVLPPVCIDKLVLAACLRSPELTALDAENGRSAGGFKLEHLDAWFTSPPQLSEGQVLYAGTSRGKLVSLTETIEKEMTEEEASRARFEDLLGRRRTGEEGDDGVTDSSSSGSVGAGPGK